MDQTSYSTLITYHTSYDNNFSVFGSLSSSHRSHRESAAQVTEFKVLVLPVLAVALALSKLDYAKRL